MALQIILSFIISLDHGLGPEYVANSSQNYLAQQLNINTGQRAIDTSPLSENAKLLVYQ